MTTRMFNGTTLSFGSSVGKVTGITFRVAGEVVDVTDPGDAMKLFEVGQNDIEVSIDLNGGAPPARGTKATPTITWADGSSTPTTGNWIVTQSQVTGRQNSRITSQFTIKPTI